MISFIVSRLVILFIGTLYPAYASYKAVRTKNVKEYVKWMMYWIVFALFTCAEVFTDVFLSFWFPFYYEIKIILVLWLLSPTTKGSSILYRRFVHPALCQREAEIDDALARATEQGYSAVLQLGSKGVNYAATVLMQTAMKNLPNVGSDLAVSSLASRRVSSSRSETDARESPTEYRRPRRRTMSNDTGIAAEKAGARNYIDVDSSENDSHADMHMDHMPSVNSTTESLDLADFKVPQVLKKEPRTASVSRRKPRTRNRSRNLDSDFSDDN